MAVLNAFGQKDTISLLWDKFLKPIVLVVSLRFEIRDVYQLLQVGQRWAWRSEKRHVISYVITFAHKCGHVSLVTLYPLCTVDFALLLGKNERKDLKI